LRLAVRLALLLAVFGGVVGGVWGGIAWYKRSVLAMNVDRLHEKVLAGGNIDTAWRQADPRFQALYPLPVFRNYARRRPALFVRDRLTGTDVEWLTSRGDLVVVITARVEEDGGPAEVRYYCSRSERAGFRLLGIGPDLAAAVPTGLGPYPGAGKQ
jgi:hypothetical protein